MFQPFILTLTDERDLAINILQFTKVRFYTTNIADEQNQETESEPYHHWWDGSPIYLNRTPVEDSLFDIAESEEILTQDVVEENIVLKIGYANMPMPKICLSNRNIFDELIDSFPEIDIWALCELYWTHIRFRHMIVKL